MFDSVHEEPALQAGLFDGFDVNYTQLSYGKFKGRVSSAHLGQVSIYVEYANQALEKQLKVSPYEFAFFLLLDGKDPSYSYGISKSEDWVHVVPPNGETILVCPKDTVLLTFTVSRNANDMLASFHFAERIDIAVDDNNARHSTPNSGNGPKLWGAIIGPGLEQPFFF